MFKKFLTAAVAVGLLVTNFSATEAKDMDNEKKVPVKVVQTAGRDRLGEFAPEFARYNDDVLFGEIWSRNNILSMHDRSLITVSALMSMGLVNDSFKHHLEFAKKNGVTKAEMVEVITQLAFYTGWPKAWAAFNMAKEVYAE